jgi:hypothetical protein
MATVTDVHELKRQRIENQRKEGNSNVNKGI